MTIAYADIRDYLVAELAARLRSSDRPVPADFTDDFDFFEHAVIDSVGYVELITSLEDRFGVSLDFESMDESEMTVIGPLCRLVEARLAGG